MKHFGVMTHLNVFICEDGADAANKGYVYRDGFSRLDIEKVVVVRRGTQRGNSTVEFVMVDEAGKRYVVMLTGNLLRSIPCGAGGETVVSGCEEEMGE